MKKEYLVEKGMSEEHAQIAVDAYNEAIKGFIPKSRFDEVNGQLKTVNGELKAAKEQLQTADGKIKTLEGAQSETETLKSMVTELEGENTNLKKTYELKDALRAAKCIDPDYIIFKRGGIDKFEFAEDGKPKVDDVVKEYKESAAHLFQQETKAGYVPAGGSGTPSLSRGEALAKERNQKTEPKGNDPWAAN